MFKGLVGSAEEAVTFPRDCQEPPAKGHGARTGSLPHVWGAWPEEPPRVCRQPICTGIPARVPPGTRPGRDTAEWISQGCNVHLKVKSSPIF